MNKTQKKSPIVTIGRREVSEFVYGKDKQSEKGGDFTEISWSRIVLSCIFLHSTKYKVSPKFRLHGATVFGAGRKDVIFLVESNTL